MLRIATLANLITYSIVVSQPLAYLVFLERAQMGLSPTAYIELRQRINPVMARRVGMIYVSTLLTLSLLLGLSLREGASLSVATSIVGLTCLLIDVFFMVRENLPINGVVDQWSATNYPADWEDYRTKWFAVFAYREAALLVGFVSTLIGAVFQF